MRAQRMGAIYTLDERAAVRASHENPSLGRLYNEFLGEPGGALARELLHTSYEDRSRNTVPPSSAWEHAALPGPPAQQRGGQRPS